MPDATYVGAGMPCGNCGNPLTAGQPHKCGRTPDFDRRLDESWEPSPAASPDERLREAVAALPQYIITIQDREGYTYERGCEGQPMNYTGVMLADVEALVGKLKDGATTARETTNELKDAAADREKPDGCHAPHCWSEYGTPCGTCPVAAASPDERLREAARVLVERSAAAVCQPGQFRDNVGEAQWRLSDAITATRAALAADREAPDGPR